MRRPRQRNKSAIATDKSYNPSRPVAAASGADTTAAAAGVPTPLTSLSGAGGVLTAARGSLPTYPRPRHRTHGFKRQFSCICSDNDNSVFALHTRLLRFSRGAGRVAR